MKEKVQAIVDHNAGNVAKSAKIIGVTPTCVLHWLGRLTPTTPKPHNVERINNAYKKIVNL